MMDTNELVKIAKHAFKRGQGIPDRRLLHPRRDWAIGILLFTLVLGAGSFYGAVSFNEFRDVDTSGGVAEDRVPRYNASQIETAIETYANRAAEFSTLTAATAAPTPEATEEVAATSSDEVVTGTPAVVDETDPVTEAETTDSQSEPEADGPISFE